MDERRLVGRAPWWFRKLVEAETLEYARRREADQKYGKRVMNARTDGGDPVVPVYEGDELTLAQKLAKYRIEYEKGDEDRSAAYVAKSTPLPVPRLGTFVRDVDADIARDKDADLDFG
jgi:hypothetical protein